MFGGLYFIGAKVAEGIIRILGLVRGFAQCPVGSLRDVQVEFFILGSTFDLRIEVNWFSQSLIVRVWL